ncbi:histidine kinase [Mycobacteroides abscessus subsp. massiliense]|nr:histidine kinase [Mycobacteroides abscessus]MDO3301207.1 histidine kinase [Mycobacteroides abscessus subsp. massiliense]
MVVVVVKHGRAKNIRVELSSRGCWLTLVVTDDGRGFDSRDLVISGAGTRVSVTVPADMAA